MSKKWAKAWIAAKGHTSAACKNAFLKRFQITARQFNTCRVSLEGKIAACQAAQGTSIATLKQQIAMLDQQIHTLEKKVSKHLSLMQKQKRKNCLLERLALQEADQQQKRVRLCFGDKKLFHAQYYLEKNKLASHADWKKKWEEKRNDVFFALGSKDETSGNQTCTASLQENGTVRLRLRLPKELEATHGKYLVIDTVFFAYGQHA